jgi:hypothetical protein
MLFLLSAKKFIRHNARTKQFRENRSAVSEAVMGDTDTQRIAISGLLILFKEQKCVKIHDYMEC